METKTCIRCGVVKAIDAFFRNKNKADGRMNVCKKCQSIDPRYKLSHVRSDMIKRCMNPRDKRYNRYGSRGVKVCSQWLSGFSPFYEWAMANGWQLGLQLDRIDNDGNYCPENCRFVSCVVNVRNSDRAKLNKHQVQEIKAKLKLGWPCKQIAPAFGVTPSNINAIKRGVTWRDIQPAAPHVATQMLLF